MAIALTGYNGIWRTYYKVTLYIPPAHKIVIFEFETLVTGQLWRARWITTSVL